MFGLAFYFRVSIKEQLVLDVSKSTYWVNMTPIQVNPKTNYNSV